MSRRQRPPATAREIGAYLAGARLRRLWDARDQDRPWWERPSEHELLEALAREDTEVYLAMDKTDWWHHFWDGWDRAYQ